MANIEFEIRGLGSLANFSAEVADKIREEVEITLYQFAEEVMTASKEIVPVDTGALMNTGKVALPEWDGQELLVTLGYGDVSVGYALAVHEDLSPRHWKRPGSGPKYLENPLKDRQDQLQPLVTAAVGRALKK